LFSLGGLFALYEGFHKVEHPEPIHSWRWLPIVVLVISIVLEAFSFRTAIRESNPLRGNAGWFAFIRRSRDPELPVVLLEDSAALVGLFFALVGVSMTLVTGNGVYDGVGSLLIGALLVTVAVILAIETKSLLIGESATAEHVRAIEKAIVDGVTIERIIHMKTLHLGPDELLVAVKVGVPAESTAAQIATAIDEAEVRIRTAVPIARVIYVEPDIYQAALDSTGPAAAIA
jgi:divalent metal cation (Fe/Co/Zn/Cd) transporter